MEYVKIFIDRDFDGGFIQAFGILKTNERIFLNEKEYKEIEKFFQEEYLRNQKLWFEVCVEDE